MFPDISSGGYSPDTQSIALFASLVLGGRAFAFDHTDPPSHRIPSLGWRILFISFSRWQLSDRGTRFAAHLLPSSRFFFPPSIRLHYPFSSRPSRSLIRVESEKEKDEREGRTNGGRMRIEKLGGVWIWLPGIGNGISRCGARWMVIMESGLISA